MDINMSKYFQKIAIKIISATEGSPSIVPEKLVWRGGDDKKAELKWYQHLKVYK